ncbi:MAG: hypothetical protein WC682_04890 [Parcubacteria group bacterium]|jgi:hypothetical protein
MFQLSVLSETHAYWLISVYLTVVIIVGVWALSKNKPAKTSRLLECPKTGKKEINPNGKTHCAKCAKSYITK